MHWLFVSMFRLKHTQQNSTTYILSQKQSYREEEKVSVCQKLGWRGVTKQGHWKILENDGIVYGWVL